MKNSHFFILFSLVLFLSCKSSPDLKNDSTVPSGMPIEIHEYLPYTVAMAADGKIWQWEHTKGNEVTDIKQLDFGDVYSVGTWNYFGWVLRNDGVPVYWNLLNPLDYSAKPDKKPVKKIAASSSHLIHLYTDGTLGFMRGPMGDIRSYAGFNGMKNVVDVAAGPSFSIACTSDGKVYVTGKNTGPRIAWIKNEWIDSTHQISPLKNILKVGVAPQGVRYYAIDDKDSLFFWGQNNFEDSPINLGRKAKALIDNNYLLETNGDITQFWVLRPRATNTTQLDLKEEHPDFKEAVYFRHSNKKKFYMAVEKDGALRYYNQKIYRGEKYGTSRAENPVKIEGLLVDLTYFK